MIDAPQFLTPYAEQFEIFMRGHFSDIKSIREPLFSAMKYSLFAHGKRIRPILFRLSYEAAGGKYNSCAKLFALAIECIHAYSLIHDDLPCMDNDDLRRGQKTNHKVFGDAIALLAGDALLNYAYELIADVVRTGCSGGNEALCILAKAAGASGMVGGQSLDILGAEPDNLLDIHAGKTAALIEASCLCGALLAGAEPNSAIATALKVYGFNLGMLFQITDDLLDVRGDAQKMGKAVNKDGDKITFPHIFGIPETERRAAAYRDAAISAVGFSPELTAICAFISSRAV